MSNKNVFKEGCLYRWRGSSEKRPDRWNNEGKMDFMLDGRPRRCIQTANRNWTNTTIAQFERLPGDPESANETWSWTPSEDFEEVGEVEKATSIFGDLEVYGPLTANQAAHLIGTQVIVTDHISNIRAIASSVRQGILIRHYRRLSSIREGADLPFYDGVDHWRYVAALPELTNATTEMTIAEIEKRFGITNLKIVKEKE